MIRRDLVLGILITGDSEIPTTLSSGCELGEFARLPFKHGRNRATRIGELVHSDVLGPAQTTSLGGAPYYIQFKDDFSGYLTVYFIKKKSEVPALIYMYAIMLLNETGNHLLTRRTDNEKENANYENSTWFEERGIRHE